MKVNTSNLKKVTPLEKQASLQKPKDRVKIEKALKGQTEVTLQGLCEGYWTLLGIWYLRIPSEVYALCNPRNPVDIKVKNAISEKLSGVPDLIGFKKELINNNLCIDNSSLHVELKVDKYKQTPRQRKWARETVVHVIRNFEAFKHLTDGWIET